jgi:hypothetical protein
MTKPLAAALALTAAGALAGSAHAQIDPSRFGLELMPVWRRYADHGDGTFAVSDLPGTAVTAITRSFPGVRLRLEIRYRITVSGSTTGSYTDGTTTYASGGLCSTSFNVRLSRGSAGLQLATGPIGPAGGNTGTGYFNPVPNLDTGGGFGVYGPFRTGVFPPDNSFGGSNGTLVGTTVQNIVPLNAAAPDQRSGNTAASAARFWPLYSMDFVVPAGYGNTIASDEVIEISLERASSPGGLVPVPFFPRIDGANATSPILATGAYSAGPTMILTITGGTFPTPGTASAFALAGVLAARRQR